VRNSVAGFGERREAHSQDPPFPFWYGMKWHGHWLGPVGGAIMRHRQRYCAGLVDGWNAGPVASILYLAVGVLTGWRGRTRNPVSHFVARLGRTKTIPIACDKTSGAALTLPGSISAYSGVNGPLALPRDFVAQPDSHPEQKQANCYGTGDLSHAGRVSSQGHVGVPRHSNIFARGGLRVGCSHRQFLRMHRTQRWVSAGRGRGGARARPPRLEIDAASPLGLELTWLRAQQWRDRDWFRRRRLSAEATKTSRRS
jgi:hypothetical protein